MEGAGGSRVEGVRGRTKPQTSMLAFIDPESRIPANHPLRTIKRFADAALAELSPLFDEMYAADGQGRPSIPPERLLKASLLISLYLGAQRARLLRGARLSPAVPLVPGYGHGRAQLRPLDLHQEPRTAAAPRTSAASSSTRWCVQADRLHLLSDEHFTRGRHADRSRGQPEELPAQGRATADGAASRWQPGQSLGRLPWREALERHAPEHDRSRCAAVQERCGAGSQTVLRRVTR